jgi:predicted dehydrogenase
VRVGIVGCGLIGHKRSQALSPEIYWHRGEMGPPETIAWEYPMADDSWATEFAEFVEDIRLGRQPVPGLRDALEALRVVGIIYQESSHAHHT